VACLGFRVQLRYEVRERRGYQEWKAAKGLLTGQMVVTLGKLVTEKPVDFVDFDNVVKFNKNRQNDDNVVKAYKS
jgi:predicted thioredoxin/glutaredoxin